MKKQPVSEQAHETAQETLRLQQRVCPHWSPLSRACLLVRDGLFLPVEQHVVAYCTSSHHPACPQFQQQAHIDVDQAIEDSLPVNRRRSIRIPSHHAFRFSEITGSDQMPGHRDDDAWTIDLSNHGIRFASRQTLAPDTLIHFSLETDGTVSELNGIGRVIWAEPLETAPLFHIGLAFTEQPAPAFHPQANQAKSR